MSNPVRLFMQRWGLLVFLQFALVCPAAAALDETAANTSTTNLAERNYAELRAVLPRYEDAAAHPWPTVPEGRYRLNHKNPGVPLLRDRLKASGELPAYYSRDDTLFDSEMAQAVMAFQASHGLHADGVPGPKTLHELNVPASARLREIQINIERWATLANRRLPERFILVNIPDFRLSAYDAGRQVLTMKIIVGKPDRQTPEISSRVTRLVFNPYWNIPDMIAKRDIAPKVLENPGYLDDMHIRIFAGENDNAAEVSQEQVDWAAAEITGVPYHLRQDPGNENALGLVKFEFPNSSDVYMHDTPAKDLFEQDVRTFSSGCIRLEDPFALVTYLMDTNKTWSEDLMQGILDTGKTTYIKAAIPTPVFVTYFTAWVDDDGVVNFRDDIYDRDEWETPLQSPLQ